MFSNICVLLRFQIISGTEGLHDLTMGSFCLESYLLNTGQVYSSQPLIISVTPEAQLIFCRLSLSFSMCDLKTKNGMLHHKAISSRIVLK